MSVSQCDGLTFKSRASTRATAVMHCPSNRPLIDKGGRSSLTLSFGPTSRLSLWGNTESVWDETCRPKICCCGEREDIVVLICRVVLRTSHDIQVPCMTCNRMAKDPTCPLTRTLVTGLLAFNISGGWLASDVGACFSSTTISRIAFSIPGTKSFLQSWTNL